MSAKRQRYYVGLKAGKRELFTASQTPTFDRYGLLYNAVIGPFKTKRGALFMVNHGYNNPHCRTVYEAERLAIAYA